MIQSLQIKNYALIDELSVHFSEGLTIITGETGAGKSILLGALGLIMGKRADLKSLYDLEKKCVVEGYFDIGAYKLKRFFKTHDLDYERELVIRREITPSGKSRAFVNDTPVNLNVLQELSRSLIDLHQQFDTLDIHKVSFQLRMIDALAGNGKRLERYQAEYEHYRSDCRKLAELHQRNHSAQEELAFLQFQLEELTKAELEANQQEELEQELNRLTNAEDIKRNMDVAFRQLSEAEPSIIGQLQALNLSIEQAGQYDAQIAPLASRFEGILAELTDLANEFEAIAENTEYDPERIMEVQTTLDTIYRLQKKHGVTSVEELLAIQEQLTQQVGAIGDLDGEIQSLTQRIQQKKTALTEQAQTLSEHRHKVVAGFENKVEKTLAQLSMKHAKLKVDIGRLEELGPTGLDEVSFLFAANPGSRLQMIKDVASGGEISRLTLVIKSLVASAIPLPTLIFDEIDAGVSGDVALRMGKILQKLSGGHQVVSITHSPQIASKAHKHYFVYKKVKEGRTFTKVRELEMEGRVYAIATMLSQDPPSESAISNAKELLSLA